MNSPFKLLANHCADANVVQLAYRNVPAELIVSGHPVVGTAELCNIGACRVGVWQMSPGVSTDVEVDEFFIILSGCATVTFSDGSPAMNLKAGSIGHLSAGTATTWYVTETLRKVYLA